MFFTDIILFYVLPLVLSVVLYSLIAKMLLPSTRSRYLGGVCGNESIMCEAAIKSNQSRVQVVKMLACVVTIFAALWIPYRGLVVYNSFATMYSAPAYMDLWYLMFAKTCIYMNCAINPILYNAMSDKFRKAFRRFLFCGKLNEPPHNHLYCYNLNNKTTGLRSFSKSSHGSSSSSERE
nr:thyrotropin-releasing hormone receptor-like [Lepeophtheirus salmonis]